MQASILGQPELSPTSLTSSQASRTSSQILTDRRIRDRSSILHSRVLRIHQLSQGTIRIPRILLTPRRHNKYIAQERLSMSSPKSPSRETREEKMKPRSLRTCSKGHKTASHGVLRCQGTGTSLTALSSHGKRETSSANSLKKGQHPSQASGHLSCSVAVERLRFLKGGRSIGLMRFEQSEHNARPNVRKRSDSDGMAFALSAFPLVISFGPGFILGTLPRKRMQSIAQGFDASQTTVRLGIGPALKQDRGCASQSLQTGGALIARRIVSNFGEQTGSQAFASSRQTAENGVVFMTQKNSLDLLVVGSDLLYQGKELGNQSLSQARFRSSRNRIGLQAGLMQSLKDLRCNFRRAGMPCQLKHLSNLLHARPLSSRKGRVGLQKAQTRPLLQLAKQGKRDGVIVLEASCQLVDQARLHLDQSILISCQQFEFGDLFTIRGQSVQIREICAACLGQQIGINGIRFCSRGRTTAINRARVHRVDRPAMLQEIGNEQSMRGLDNASHLGFVLIPQDLQKPMLQLVQSFCGVRNSYRTELVACLVNSQGVMFGVCPINPNVEHARPLSVQTRFPSDCALLLRCSKHGFLMISLSQEHRRGSASFLNRSSRVASRAFPLRVQQFTRASVPLAPALCRMGLL